MAKLTNNVTLHVLRRQEEIEASGDTSFITEKPIVIAEDVNHAHYATGDMPDAVMEYDILSPLDKEQVSVIPYTFAISSYKFNSFMVLWVYLTPKLELIHFIFR